MYPKDEPEDDYSYEKGEYQYERDDSTGAYHKVKHNGDGTITYDFGMGGGKVKYDKYGREC